MGGTRWPLPKASQDVWPRVWRWSNLCLEVDFLSPVASGWPYALASDGSLVGYTSDDVGCFPFPVSAAGVNIADIVRIASAVAVSATLKCVCTPRVWNRALLHKTCRPKTRILVLVLYRGYMACCSERLIWAVAGCRARRLFVHCRQR